MKTMLLLFVLCGESFALNVQGRRNQLRIFTKLAAVDDGDAKAAPVTPLEYVFGKPGEFDRDLRNLGSNPRRFFFQVGFVIPAVALLGNVFGCTSALLGVLPPGLVETSKLDTYFPVRQADGTMQKRFIAGDGAYTFLLPADWLQDEAVALAQAARYGQPLGAAGASGGGRAAEWDEVFAQERRQRKLPSTIPDAAFGPAKRSFGDGTENVSVVRSKLGPNFSLRQAFGAPTQGAISLLNNVIAPASSGRRSVSIFVEREVAFLFLR